VEAELEAEPPLPEFVTLPPEIVDRISLFINATETARTSQTKRSVWFSLKAALEYWVEVSVDAKPHN